MTGRGNLVFRLLADLLIGLSALAVFVFNSHRGITSGTATIAVFCALIVAACLAGYLETSAKWVWIHGLILMLPELVALAAAIRACHGFECGGLSGFVVFAGVFALVLVALSAVTFFTTRWVRRPSSA